MRKSSARPRSEAVLRAPRVGDLSFVVHRATAAFARDHGFDWTSEGLVFDILSDFIANFDPAKERAWIAELDGATVGSVILARGDWPGIAKLRLFFVEPTVRNRGVGAMLFAECIAQARASGYHRLELWAFDALLPARRMFEASGFRIASRTRHHIFGRDVNGEIWALDLRAG